jgi:hypothetical protein
LIFAADPDVASNQHARWSTAGGGGECYALSENPIGRIVMLALFPQAMPIQGLIGGLLIGLASAVMLLGLGRIAGVSGLAARSIGLTDSGAPRLTALAG